MVGKDPVVGSKGVSRCLFCGRQLLAGVQCIGRTMPKGDYVLICVPVHCNYCHGDAVRAAQGLFIGPLLSVPWSVPTDPYVRQIGD